MSQERDNVSRHPLANEMVPQCGAGLSPFRQERRNYQRRGTLELKDFENAVVPPSLMTVVAGQAAHFKQDLGGQVSIATGLSVGNEPAVDVVARHAPKGSDDRHIRALASDKNRQIHLTAEPFFSFGHVHGFFHCFFSVLAGYCWGAMPLSTLAIRLRKRWFWSSRPSGMSLS